MSWFVIDVVKITVGARRSNKSGKKFIRINSACKRGDTNLVIAQLSVVITFLEKGKEFDDIRIVLVEFITGSVKTNYKCPRIAVLLVTRRRDDRSFIFGVKT